jgi:hypothetical protein
VPSEFSPHTNPNKTQIPPLGWSFVFCETQKNVNVSGDRTVSQDRIAYDRTIKLAISCPFVVRIGKHSRKPPQKVSIKGIYVMHLNQVYLLGLGLICLITYYSVQCYTPIKLTGKNPLNIFLPVTADNTNTMLT